MKFPRIAILLVLILAGMGGIWLWYSSGKIMAQSAVVDGRTLSVTAKIPGYVQEAPVNKGDMVRKGQLLFRLDRTEYEVGVAEERMMLAKIAATLPPQALVRHPDKAPPADGKTLAQARTEENTLRKALEAASDAQARASLALATLMQRPASERSDEALAAARRAEDAARAALEKGKSDFEKTSNQRATLEAEERRVQTPGGQVPAALAAQVAAYNAQMARVKVTEENLAATSVLAPRSGRVIEMTVRAGQTIEPGAAGVTIAPEGEDGLWITAVFTPEQAARLSPGQECDVVLPARGNLALKGRIEGISPAARGQKNAAARIVFVDYGALPQGLAPGEAATVTIFTRAREAAAPKNAGSVNATR